MLPTLDFLHFPQVKPIPFCFSMLFCQPLSSCIDSRNARSRREKLDNLLLLLERYNVLGCLRLFILRKGPPSHSYYSKNLSLAISVETSHAEIIIKATVLKVLLKVHSQCFIKHENIGIPAIAKKVAPMIQKRMNLFSLPALC